MLNLQKNVLQITGQFCCRLPADEEIHRHCISTVSPCLRRMPCSQQCSCPAARMESAAAPSRKLCMHAVLCSFSRGVLRAHLEHLLCANVPSHSVSPWQAFAAGHGPKLAGGGEHPQRLGTPTILSALIPCNSPVSVLLATFAVPFT